MIGVPLAVLSLLSVLVLSPNGSPFCLISPIRMRIIRRMKESDTEKSGHLEGY